MKSLDTMLHWSTMPDGMPHGKASESSGPSYVIASIRSPLDLMKLGIAHNIKPIACLEIHYLMGGRMDRRIDDRQPNTLKVVANFIRSLGIPEILCVWPHSQATIDRLDAIHWTGREKEFLRDAFRTIRGMLGHDEFGLVLPDAGAEKRFWNDHRTCFEGEVISCTKHRDMATGKLSGFSVQASSVPEHCVIVDDLCDGGRTFTSIASHLRNLGANKVGLVAYHGIFSGGTELSGIDAIVTSNSFRNFQSTPSFYCIEVLS